MVAELVHLTFKAVDAYVENVMKFMQQIWNSKYRLTLVMDKILNK